MIYLSTNKFIGLTLELGESHPNVRTAQLPSLTFFDYDEDGKYVKMELLVERDVTPYETYLLNTLLLLSTNQDNVVMMKGFSVLAFVRKNNLEKHFSFAEA